MTQSAEKLSVISGKRKLEVMEYENETTDPLATEPAGITEDEVALYDRQIRLWGIDVQQRLRNAAILIVGVRALANEVIKNLVLAGVGSVTLLDHSNATQEDIGPQFLLPEDSVGKNRAECAAERTRALNPRVHLTVDKGEVSEKADDFFAQFGVVFVSGCGLNTLKRIDNICRKNDVKFFASDCHGLFGYLFVDLTTHKYLEAKQKIIKGAPKDAEKVEVKTEMEEKYVSLTSALTKKYGSMSARKMAREFPKIYASINALWRFGDIHKRLPSPKDAKDLDRLKEAASIRFAEMQIDTGYLDERFLETLIRNVNVEISPVCAIVGGFVAQEILKTISGNELPVNNFFVFDGSDFTGKKHRSEP